MSFKDKMQSGNAWASFLHVMIYLLTSKYFLLLFFFSILRHFFALNTSIHFLLKIKVEFENETILYWPHYM